MKNTFLILSGIILLTLFSCNSQSGRIQIFNPYSGVLTVTLNDKSYDIGAREAIDVQVEAGDCALKCTFKNEMITDTTIRITYDLLREGGLLNVTGDKIYTLSEHYDDEQSMSFSTIMNMRAIIPVPQDMLEELSDSAYRAMITQQLFAEMEIFYSSEMDPCFLIDSFLVIGNITEYQPHDIVIVKNWDYWLDEEFPEEIEIETTHGGVSLGASRRKVFTREELLSYYMELYWVAPEASETDSLAETTSAIWEE